MKNPFSGDLKSDFETGASITEINRRFIAESKAIDRWLLQNRIHSFCNFIAVMVLFVVFGFALFSTTFHVTEHIKSNIVEELKTEYQHKKDLDAINKLFRDGTSNKKE